MARIGIYGSSFDPITNVHLWTASTVAHRCKLDEVIFLPSSNKRIDKIMHAGNEHRMDMVNLAIQNNEKFTSSDYELKQHGWKLTTYETLKYFKELFPTDDIYFIIGANLLVDIGAGKWGNAEALVKENNFIVMAREGINMLEVISKAPVLRNNDNGTTFHLLDKGLSMEISSSYVREEFSMDGEARYLLPDSCYQYIKDKLIYTNRFK